MAAKQNVAGSITEKKRPATVLQSIGVLIRFSYWKGLIFDGAANERITVCALISRALLIAAIFCGVMSSSVFEKDYPTTRTYGFVGVFVGFVGVMCYVEKFREKVQLFASLYREEILYAGFLLGASYLYTKLSDIDLAGLVSMLFLTSSVMMYQFETNELEQHFGLIDVLLILQGAMVGLNVKDKTSFIRILFFFLMFVTLVFRVYINPDHDADPLPHHQVAVAADGVQPAEGLTVDGSSWRCRQ